MAYPLDNILPSNDSSKMTKLIKENTVSSRSHLTQWGLIRKKQMQQIFHNQILCHANVALSYNDHSFGYFSAAWAEQWSDQWQSVWDDGGVEKDTNKIKTHLEIISNI